MKSTKIQWCHSTVNPIMGCSGCELFPSPSTILDELDEQLSRAKCRWKKGMARRLYRIPATIKRKMTMANT